MRISLMNGQAQRQHGDCPDISAWRRARKIAISWQQMNAFRCRITFRAMTGGFCLRALCAVRQSSDTLPVKANDQCHPYAEPTWAAALPLSTLSITTRWCHLSSAVLNRGPHQRRDIEVPRWRLRKMLSLIRGHFDIDRLSVAQRAQLTLVPGFGGGDPRTQFGRKLFNGLPFQTHDDVPDLIPLAGDEV